jgi:hypothetical protein
MFPAANENRQYRRIIVPQTKGTAEIPQREAVLCVQYGVLQGARAVAHMR